MVSVNVVSVSMAGVSVVSVSVVSVIVASVSVASVSVTSVSVVSVASVRVANVSVVSVVSANHWTQTKNVCVAESVTEVQCITQNEGFQPVVLDVNVLQTAYFNYRQQYGSMNLANNE